MRLWHLKRFGKTGYDEVNSFIVCATDAHDARRIASAQCGDEGADTWIDYRTSSCECISTSTTAKPGVVTRDFNSG